MRPGSIWVAELIVSARTAEKLIGRHQLHEQDVRDEIVCVPGLRFRWHEHPERGWRVIVEVAIRDRACLVVLYEVADPMGDVWALGSCYLV